MELQDKIWWTRKSRIQTEKRLIAGNSHAQAILLWYAFSSVSASVFYLVRPPVPGDQITPGIWVILSIFSLVASGFVTALNLRARASQVKECYEQLGALLGEVGSNIGHESEQYKLANDRYLRILSLCENHTNFDYRAARCEMHFSGDKNFLPAISRYDLTYFALMKAKYFLGLSFLYLLPVIAFFVLQGWENGRL